MRDSFLERLKQQLSDIPVPDPGEGWERMKGMLDETDRVTGPVFIRWWQVAAFLALSAGGAGLLLSRTGVDHLAPTGGATVVARHAKAGASAVRGPIPARENAGVAQFGNGAQPPAGSTGILPADRGLGSADVLAAAGPDLGASPETTPCPGGADLRSGPCGPPIASLPGSNPSRGHSHWLVDAGLGANVRGSFSRLPKSGDQYSLRAGLYPVARVSYRLNNRWTLASGLSVPSPVFFKNPGATASAEDDSLLAAKGLSGARRVSRILYVNLPLEVQYQVLKGLFVEGGVQASLVTAKDYYAPYYGNSLAATTAPQSFIPGFYTNAGVGHEGLTNPSVRNADWRAVAGLLYRLKRFGAEMQFQHGLDHSANEAGQTGDVSTTRTNVVGVNLTFQVN